MLAKYPTIHLKLSNLVNNVDNTLNLYTQSSLEIHCSTIVDSH